MNEFENPTPAPNDETDAVNSTEENTSAEQSSNDTPEESSTVFEDNASLNSGSFEPPFANIPVNNPINYTPITPTPTAVEKRGLKVFCLILAAVLILTGGCLTGYMFAKNNNSSLLGYADVDLASRPKDSDELTAAQVYEKVSPSVVGIRIYNDTGKSGLASGVVYSKDGYIVTNDHIYSEIPAAKFKIYMQDGIEYDAEYVAGDVISDLAVLKIKEPTALEEATFGDSSEIYCGERVAAIGRPTDATAPSSITTGIISLTSVRTQTSSSYSARLIQTDSAINPGSSGGALVNMYGQVIGITSSKVTGYDYDRIGFAIPTTTVKRIAEQLIAKGKVTDRAKLGITYTFVDSVTADLNDIDTVGLYIQSVSEDSDLYGKLKEGDVITHINDVAATRDEFVLDVIDSCRAGDTITVTVTTSKGITVNYTAKLKANIGESSYLDNIPTEDTPSSEDSNGNTFDFPFGE